MFGKLKSFFGAADPAFLGPAGKAFVMAVKAKELTLEEIKHDKTVSFTKPYNRSQSVWANFGKGVSPASWAINKNNLTKAYYKYTKKNPYSWSGVSYHGGYNVYFVSSGGGARFNIAADWEDGKQEAIIYLDEQMRDELKRLETDKRLTDLKTANELVVQQANIEKAKWQSEKEKLEQAILIAKMRQEEIKTEAAEEKQMEAALKKAQMQDAEDKAKKRKKTVRNLAVGAAAIAALTQVM